jgi:hypothetical protein
MVQGQAPVFRDQVLETDTYSAKLVGDDIGEFDEVVFDSGAPVKTGNKVFKYWADLEFDGIEDIGKPGKCYVKRLFFTLSISDKANLPKFLRAIKVPVDGEGNFDTSAAVNRAWVLISMVKETAKGGGFRNKIEGYIADKSRKPTENPALEVVPLDAQGWAAEEATEAPF